MDLKIEEFKDQNQQIVFDLIMDFVENKDNIIVDEEYEKKYSENLVRYFQRDYYNPDASWEAFRYIFRLRLIASKFILFENFGAKILIAQILKEYSNSIYSEPEFLTYGIPYEQYKETGYCLGVLDFLNYKKALITEKDIFGYKNLVIACEIEKELSKKK